MFGRVVSSIEDKVTGKNSCFEEEGKLVGIEDVGQETNFLTARLTGQHRLGWQELVDAVFAGLVRPDRLGAMTRRGRPG